MFCRQFLERRCLRPGPKHRPFLGSSRRWAALLAFPRRGVFASTPCELLRGIILFPWSEAQSELRGHSETLASAPDELSVPAGLKNPAPHGNRFAIAMKDDRSFAFASLWEGCKDRATDQWLHTCTVMTIGPNELVAQAHTRMAVILAEEDHAKWLGEIADGDLKELLKPYPADEMKMWSISQRSQKPAAL